MAKRIKFEVHVTVSAGVKATKASLSRAVKAWINEDKLPKGHEVLVIRWQNDNRAWKETDEPDSERAWLGRLLPWAHVQIQEVRPH